MTDKQDDIEWSALEHLVHADPTARGLASFRRAGVPIDADQLRTAALHIARRAEAVGIVTGFCAVSAEGVTAETDGPPSALFLARALRDLGIDACLISDAYGLPLLRAGCELWNLDSKMLVECPLDDVEAPRAADTWADTFMKDGRGSRLTHLIAIERPGPAHTLESLAAQSRDSAAPLKRFAAAVPQADRNVCHNMRGESIEPWTARTHRLFEVIAENKLPITTIGIGDGGNELGMGRFAWEIIVEAIGSSSSARIVCRVATDYTLVGGVSDWAGYALALAVARLRGSVDCAHLWTAESQRKLVACLVASGAVDGVTLRRQATIDALPLDVYLEPLVRMRRLLGFDRD